MNTTPSSNDSPRLHHLDALRAFAMLLGLVLHGVLSFAGIPWLVRDRSTDEAYRWVFEAIHGFRMPLFIFVSGFFTMLLYRRRGLNGLVDQRFQRVFLPCILGLVTLIPLLRLATVFATDQAAQHDATQAIKKSDLVEAIRLRSLDEVRFQLDQGANPDETDPEFGVPPLAWAALYGEVRMATLLLDRGAKIGTKDRGGYQPIHTAAFLGQVSIVKLLVERGADPQARGALNDTPRDSTRADLNTTKAITTAMRVPLGNEKVLAERRQQCRTYLEGLSADGGRPVGERTESVIEAGRRKYLEWLIAPAWSIRFNPQGPPTHLIFTGQFDHLWFLWFLCWFVGLFAIVALLTQWSNWSRLPAVLILSRFRLLWLLPLTLLPQLFMGVFGLGFGPDTSTGVIPQPHLLVYYGLFFFGGCLYGDTKDEAGRLGSWWWLWLLIAAVAMPLGKFWKDDVLLGGVLQVLYAWAMTFGLLGLFRTVLKCENRIVRYLSDSAYWLYLAHLPMMIVGQALVRDWDAPSLVKCSVLIASVTVILLISYQLLVRHFWLGRLLNGPRPR